MTLIIQIFSSVTVDRAWNWLKRTEISDSGFWGGSPSAGAIFRAQSFSGAISGMKLIQ